jgi:type IV secretion system protein VirD4
MSRTTLTASWSLAALCIWSFSASLILMWLLKLPVIDTRPWTWLEFLFVNHWSPLAWSKAKVAMFGATLLVGGIGVLSFLKGRAQPFGDARFAKTPEIRAAGLMNTQGLILGKYRGRYLLHDKPGHVFLSAPNRSGKGVGIVIPNLLTWQGSTVVLDIKGENFELTSGFRQEHGQDVFLFAPASEHGISHRFNPFDAVRDDRRFRIADIQQIARFLIPNKERSDIWEPEARSLFLALALYVLDMETCEKNIGEINRLLRTNEDLGDIAKHVLKTYSDKLDPACIMEFGNFAQKATKERSGVKSTLTAALALWTNPLIDAATATSDFSVADLRRKPMSIYVSVSLNQLATVAPLLNLFFQQIVDTLSRHIPGDDEPHQVLMMIDEFAALGKMDILASALPFLAGFKVRFLTVTQGLTQLDELYGQTGRETFLQNATVQIFFAPNDRTTALFMSERLGSTTVDVTSTSRGKAGHVTRSKSPQRRELMTPDEVRRLDPGQEILFVEAARPIKAEKIVYFKDKMFTARLLKPASVPKLKPVLRLLPDILTADDGEAAQAPQRRISDAPVQQKLADQQASTAHLAQQLEMLLNEEAAENADFSDTAAALKAELRSLVSQAVV